jgi:hypothetical protein
VADALARDQRQHALEIEARHDHVGTAVHGQRQREDPGRMGERGDHEVARFLRHAECVADEEDADLRRSMRLHHGLVGTGVPPVRAM